MPHLLRLSRLLLGALLVAGWASHAAAQIGRINGVVKNDEGQAIKGATVTATSDASGTSLTASTDDKGRFTMIGLRAGLWAFIAAAPGHRTNGARMQVRAANVNPPLLLALDRNGPGIGGALERVTAKDLQANLTSAEALFRQQKWDEAIAAYRAILGMAAPLRIVQLQLAAAYIGKKDFPSAQAAYRELLKAEPANERAAVGLAELQRQMGDTKAAEQTLTEAAKVEGAGREVFDVLGDLARTDGRADEAAEWFTKASAVDPYWGRPLYKLGESALKKGDRAAATAYWQRAARVDPTSPEAALAKTALAQLNQ